MNEPDKLIAGATYTWNEDWSGKGYPATTWTCQYTFNGPSKLQVSGIASGAGFVITLSSTNTATLAPGTYAFLATVTSAGQTFVVSQGTILVSLSIAAQAAGQEQRSVNKQILDALEASMVNAATRDQLEMQIGGRSIKYMSLAEKIKALNFFRRAVASDKVKEKAANGQDDPGGRIMTRFTPW